MRHLTLAAIAITMAGCSGMSTDYDRPAEAGQIPFSVAAVSPDLVSELRVSLPEPSSPPTGTKARSEYAYRIGTADVIALYVDQPLFTAPGDSAAENGAEPEPAQLYTVSEQGEIFLPLHGPLEVAGLTLTETYEGILTALRDYIANPQINVSVAEYRSQRATVVVGDGSGTYLPISDQPLTIVDAIIQAVGATSADLDLRSTVLKRDGRDYPVDVRALMDSNRFGSDWLLQDGDVVVVPDNGNGVYLLGEMPNQRRPIDPFSTTLAEVLMPQAMPGQGGMQGGNQGGGFLNSGAADIGSIFVIRGTPERAQVYHLNARTPDSIILAERFPMQDGDVVFTTTRNVSRFNRYIAELLPSLAPVLIASQFD